MDSLASPKNDHLAVRRHIHMKALFGDRDEAGTTRRIADLGLQLYPRGVRRVALAFQRAKVSRLVDPERPPSNDAHGHREETQHPQADERARGESGASPATALTLAALYAARHARSLALRDRGLRAISVSPGVTARRVSVSPSARPRQVHIGCFGGQTQSALHSRNACLTRRSSPE